MDLDKLTPEDLDAIHPGFREAFQWQYEWDTRNKSHRFFSLSKLENRLIVFEISKCKFLRLLHIDNDNSRYETYGERGHYWVSYGNGFTFDWTDEKTFDKLYELYRSFPGRIRYQSKRKLIEWFCLAPRGIKEYMEQLPAELDEGQFGNIYKEEVKKIEQEQGDISDKAFVSPLAERFENFLKKLASGKHLEDAPSLGEVLKDIFKKYVEDKNSK